MRGLARQGTHRAVVAHPSQLDIVVADDDPSDKMLLTMAAREACVDAEFTFVSDGLELVRLIEQRAADGALPALIVLDIRMPRCSGLEAMATIAGNEQLASVPVVMFTTSRRAADEQRAIELGVRRFVVKPSGYPELVDFVRELMPLARQAGVARTAPIDGADAG